MTSIDLLKLLNADFPGHAFKFICIQHPDDFSKQYVISIDGIVKKLFQVSWEESVQQIIVNYEELKKKITEYLNEITTESES